MKCAIFTYGKFSSEYGGQCRLLSNGFKKKGINIVKLEGKKSSSLLKYFFYICGLRTGLMFTGFGYKSNIPKILTNANIIISFAQTIPWNLFFYIIFKNKKIIYWNDMPINKISDIYVSGFFWKSLVIYINIIQRFFLNHKIIATNKYQFKNNQKVFVVPRIVDNYFFEILKKKNDTKTFTLVLIGNDFVRKKFNKIILIVENLFLKLNLKLNIYIIGRINKQYKFYPAKNIFIFGELNKKKIAKLLNNLNYFFTISLSEKEGAPISLLEIQAAGGISLCTKNNGGREYVPKECQFDTKETLIKNLVKIIKNTKFSNYIRRQSLNNLKKNTDKNIAGEILSYSKRN